MESLLVKIFATALALSQVTTAPGALRPEFDRDRDQRDVALLLRQPTEAVAVGARVVGIHIANLVQGAEELAHALEDRGDERRLLALGVGPFGDPDLEPEGSKAGLRERMAGAESVGRIDRLHQHGGDLRILVQDLARSVAAWVTAAFAHLARPCACGLAHARRRLPQHSARVT